jgi:hypothetical protein
MLYRVTATWMRKPAASALGVAALAAVVLLLHGTSPIAAKPRDCQAKFAACVHRCIENNATTEGAFRCEQRTCDKQFDNCIADLKKDDKSKLATGNDKFTHAPPPLSRPPRGAGGLFDTGILGGGFGSATQAPAAAGTAVSAPAAPAAPSAPPVIIR